MNDPLISFVIPSYNSADTIHPAIESCVNQTYKNVEVIVVNDFSTDSTWDYLKWLEKQEWAGKVRIINNEKNLGRSASRNAGNRAARGEIICVLDADDLSVPRRAEMTVERFKKGARMVYGQAHVMDAVGRNLGLMKMDVFNKEKAMEVFSVGICHSTVAYSKELSEKYPYLEGEPARLGVDDFTIFLPMALDGVEFDFIPAPLCAYRINESGITAVRDTEETVAFKKKFVESLKVSA